MKIGNSVIKNIELDNDEEFVATYKDHHIEISSIHDLGDPQYDHLTRYNIVVRYKDGSLVVGAYEDFHCIRDAIRYALEGSELLR